MKILNIIIFFIKNLFRPEVIKPIVKEDFFIPKNKLVFNKLYKLGNKYPNKTFYVIKKYFAPNGFFSNLTFVISHYKFALSKKYIPIVDMKNFVTIYNEKKMIDKCYNAWEYYFEQLSEYKLEDVYNSKKVIFSGNEKLGKSNLDENYKLKKFVKKIKIKKKIYLEYSKLKKKIFKPGLKILGVLVTGTMQKIARGHALPLQPRTLVNEIEKIFNNHKCNKVFLVTEDNSYLRELKKKFHKKLIYLQRPRSTINPFFSHNLHFENYFRKFHRYKLGKEILIDALLLTNADVFVGSVSNVTRFVKIYSSVRQKTFDIVTENNSYNRFLARWNWYLRVYLPFFFKKISYVIK